MFGTLIALLRDGVPVLGVIDQPITKERWLGVQGRPTTLNGKQIATLLRANPHENHPQSVKLSQQSLWVMSCAWSRGACLAACWQPLQ